MVKEAGSKVDREERKAVYRQITEIALDECFTIPVCEQPRAFAWKTDVKDFSVTLDNVPNVAELWLDR